MSKVDSNGFKPKWEKSGKQMQKMWQEKKQAANYLQADYHRKLPMELAAGLPEHPLRSCPEQPKKY